MGNVLICHKIYFFQIIYFLIQITKGHRVISNKWIVENKVMLPNIGIGSDIKISVFQCFLNCVLQKSIYTIILSKIFLCINTKCDSVKSPLVHLTCNSMTCNLKQNLMSKINFLILLAFNAPTSKCVFYIQKSWLNA